MRPPELTIPRTLKAWIRQEASRYNSKSALCEVTLLRICAVLDTATSLESSLQLWNPGPGSVKTESFPFISFPWTCIPQRLNMLGCLFSSSDAANQQGSLGLLLRKRPPNMRPCPSATCRTNLEGNHPSYSKCVATQKCNTCSLSVACSCETSCQAYSESRKKISNIKCLDNISTLAILMTTYLPVAVPASISEDEPVLMAAWM